MLITSIVSDRKPSTIEADVMIVPVFAGRILTDGFSSAVRKKLIERMRTVRFDGEAGTAEFFVWRGAGVRALFFGLVGLGDQRSGTDQLSEALRRGIARIVRDGRMHGVRSIALDLSGVDAAASLSAAAVEGVELAQYRYTKYSRRLKQEQRERAILTLTLVVGKHTLKAAQLAVAHARRVVPGVLLARDLVNRPAGEMQPRTLVQAAQALAKSSPSISVTAWGRKQAQQRGFTAFLAVARGSVEEPYIIHLIYKPSTVAIKKVFVVGKGITFDSGGLNLKPTGYMEAMKLDMAGAAAVLGLFSVLPKLRLPIEVHGVIAACENMVSGSAYRPGDILRAKNGKTIEVLNTDAEGRIVLADALSFAVDNKPDMVIDLATLTGACMIALGETYAGLWSNDQSLSEDLLGAARATGEGLAAMPMPSEYHQYLESKVADVRNVRGPTERIGDAIYAAFFLKEFVGKIPWAHLDIAGPAYMEKDILPYYPLGGTGYGVRTLVEFLRRVGTMSAKLNS